MAKFSMDSKGGSFARFQRAFHAKMDNHDEQEVDEPVGKPTSGPVKDFLEERLKLAVHTTSKELWYKK